MPRPVAMIRTFPPPSTSSMSWNASRSPVTMVTSTPSRAARPARVAITSSASKPSERTLV